MRLDFGFLQKINTKIYKGRIEKMNLGKISNNKDYLKALEDYESGNYKSARNRLIKLIKAREEFEVSSLLLGMVELKQGDFIQAKDRVEILGVLYECGLL